MINRKKYAIEDGHKPPPEYAERTYYPWREVKIGGSFFIPETNNIAIRSCRQNVYAANRRFEAKGEPNRYRAWREYADVEKRKPTGMRILRTE